MDIKLGFALIAGLLFVVGNSWYIVDLVKGQVVPQRITWLIYAILELISFSNQLASGAGYGSIPYLFGGAAVTVVLLLSIKRGTGGTSLLDISVLGMALAGVIGWQLADAPIVSVLLSALAIIIASIPTLLKIFKDPFSENYPAWSIPTIGVVFNILALDELTFATVLIPIVWIVNNVTIILAQLILRPRSSKRPHPDTSLQV